MTERTMLIIAAATLLLAAWLLRYDIVEPSGSGNQAVTFRLDRWTGEVVYCAPSKCGSLRQEQ